MRGDAMLGEARQKKEVWQSYKCLMSQPFSLSLALSRSLSSPLKHLSGQVIAKLRRCGEQKGRQKLLCVMLISWGRMFMGMFKGMIMPYVACNSLGRKVPNLV